MTVLQSEIAVGSEQFEQNKQALLAQIAEVRAVQNRILKNHMQPNPNLTRKVKFYRMNVSV